MSTSIVKKISLKELGINVKQVVKDMDEGEERAVARIWGKAHRYNVKITDLGPSIQLMGNFSGINIETGEDLRGPSCYMPGVASDLVAAALEDSDMKSAVEFAFDIYMVEGEDNVMGFSYSCKSLMDPADDDAVIRLQKVLPPLPSALLEAPEESEESEKPVTKPKKARQKKAA